MIRKLLFIPILLACSLIVNAQKSYYTILQGGANLGFANEGYEGNFNGYHFHFIFGRNYNERAFLGLGLGSEKFQGKYKTNDPNEANQNTYEYEYSLFPIFIDGRLPIGGFNESSRIGLLANAGYAPAVGPVFDKGALFKAGFFYLYDTGRRTNYTASFTYGYQQLTKNAFAKDFQHQHFNISIGLMLK